MYFDSRNNDTSNSAFQWQYNGIGIKNLDHLGNFLTGSDYRLKYNIIYSDDV